jgi:hypothetical protein
MHPPAQSVSPVGHEAAHAPSAHTWLAAQAAPQAPQSCGSLASETQAPLHEVSPGAQAHLLATHTLPALHAIPHPPQSAASEVGSTHCPLHDTKPAGQAQAPALQISPPVQAMPQAPQFCGSVSRSMQLCPQAV